MSLKPEYVDPSDELFQITRDNVSPERMVTLADGSIVSETIPSLEGELMMDGAGNLLHVPLQCGRQPNTTMPGMIYAHATRLRAIAGGFVPRAECPYTERFSNDLKIPMQPLVRPPDRDRACNGHSDGCMHWHKVRDQRLAKTRAEYDRTHQKDNMVDITHLKAIAQAIGHKVEEDKK
jgi:hypothetical protein